MMTFAVTFIWALALVFSAAILAGVLREASKDYIQRHKIQIGQVESLKNDVLPAIVGLLTVVSARLAPPNTPDAEVKSMPPRLVDWISSWDDPWAVQGQKAYADELYREHQDWTRVEAIMRNEVDESMKARDE